MRNDETKMIGAENGTKIGNIGGNENRNDNGFVPPNTCIDRFFRKIPSEFRIVNEWPISLNNTEAPMLS
jgi:hypothetical protein